MPDMKHTVCLVAAAHRMQLGTSLADSLAWQTHLPDATADDTSLYPNTVPHSTGGSYEEKLPRLRLASSYLAIGSETLA
jgi:hypothetical protein